MVRTTDGQEVHSCKRYFEESPIGAIAVTVSVRVTELAIDVDHYDMPAEFQVRLMVERENDDAPDKPDIWSVMYVHSPGLLSGLTAYLFDYCPAPDAVLDVLRNFDYRIA